MDADRTRASVRAREAADSALPQPAPTVAAPVALRPAPVAGLTVGHADDPAERRADAMAETALARLQRLTAAAGTDPQTRAAADPAGVSPVDVLRHEATVRRRAEPAEVGASGGELSAATSRSVASLLDGGAPLPTPLRSTMESAFGADFGSVRLHTGAVATGLSRALHARAFTVDRTVIYGGAASELQTDEGRHVLAHELAHVLQNRAGDRPAGPSPGRRRLRRFDVSLHFAADPEIPNARVSGLTFTGRPGDTFIGGDPHGARRHLVSWGLEQQAYQAAVAGLTMRQLADHYGGDGSPATKQSVEAAIKARIAGHSGTRLVHQGSEEGNQALGLMEQQGKAQLRQPHLSPQDRFRAHVMAFMGAIDMPAFGAGDAGQNRALLNQTVARAAGFYVVANGLPGGFHQQLVDEATAALWNDRTGTYRSGDEVSRHLRGHVLAAQYGIPAHAAGMVGHFTVGQQQGPPRLTGPQPGQLPWHQ